MSGRGGKSEGSRGTSTQEVRHSGRVVVLHRIVGHDRGPRGAGGRQPVTARRDGAKAGVALDRPDGMATGSRTNTSDVGFLDERGDVPPFRKGLLRAGVSCILRVGTTLYP
jgi:hypothetical protein